MDSGGFVEFEPTFFLVFVIAAGVDGTFELLLPLAGRDFFG